MKKKNYIGIHFQFSNHLEEWYIQPMLYWYVIYTMKVINQNKLIVNHTSQIQIQITWKYRRVKEWWPRSRHILVMVYNHNGTAHSIWNPPKENVLSFLVVFTYPGPRPTCKKSHFAGTYYWAVVSQFFLGLFNHAEAPGVKHYNQSKYWLPAEQQRK